MRIYFPTAIFLTLALAACGHQPADSGANSSIKPVADTRDPYKSFPHHDSDLPADDDVIYGRLKNGVRYAVMHNTNPSGTGALWVRFATGSLNETEQQRGIAHFLEHMAFNGTKNVPEGDMVKRLERFGLSFGADTNASTGFTRTTYKLNLPSLSDAIVEEAFFLMRETAENMTLDQGAIDRERGVILSEKRSRDTLQFRAQVDELSFFNAGSGLVERLPIGIQETIETMSRDDFEQYYRNYYHPENTIVVFVGDLSEDAAIAKIEKYFESWQPDSPLAADRTLQTPNTDPGRIGYYYSPKSETRITVATPRQRQVRADTKESRQHRILVGLGNNIVARRISKLADQNNSGILSVSDRSFGYYEAVEGSKMSVRSTADEWQQALALVDREMRSAVAYRFLQSDLDEQIAIMRSRYSASAASASTRPTIARFGGGLVSGILDSLSGDRVFTHPQFNLEFFDTVVDRILTDDVWQAFRKEWSGFDQPTIYLSTSALLNEPESEIRTAFEAGRRLSPKPPVSDAVTTFAYTDFGKPGAILSDTYLEDVDAHLIRFKNNVLLNFKQTDSERGRVKIVAHIGDGALSIPRKDEALRRLGLNLMRGGGLDAHSSNEIRSLMVGRRVGTRIFVGPDTESIEIHGTTDPQDFATQLNLMTAYLVAPAFRASERDRYLRSLRAWYPTHDTSPQQVADKYVPRILRSGDKRFGYPDLDGFAAPTNEEATEWLKPQLLNGFTEVTIIGDIDKSTAIREVARTFGALPERNARRDSYPDMLKLKFPDGNKKPHVIHHAGAKDLSILRIYWPALRASEPLAERQLNVLRSLLRNRLSAILRERDSVTYSPGVGLYAERQFENYGYLFATVDLSPDKIEQVEKIIFSEAAAIARGEFTQDEFDRAIKPIRAGIPRRFNKNSYWEDILFDAQSSGSGLDEHRSLIADYSKISIGDIRSIAKEVLNQNAACRIYLLPKPE